MNTKTSYQPPKFPSDSNSSRNVAPMPREPYSLPQESKHDGPPLRLVSRLVASLCGQSVTHNGPLTLPAEECSSDKAMDGLSKLWLKELAHRSIWICMMLGFLAGNGSFLVAYLAKDGAWVAAIALALPTSWLWLLTFRRFWKAERILSYLEAKCPTLR